MNTASALGKDGRARWSLRLFGGFALSVLPGGEKVTSLGKRDRVLLAYLALNPKGREQRRKLTTLLWGDAADETTLDNLRNCLYGLRKSLGDSDHRVFASEGEEIVLDPAALEVDVLTFRRLAAQSGRSELEQAAGLYTGGLLDGLDIESEEFETWRRTEAARLKDQAVDVLHWLMAQLAESGETDRAIETGQRLLSLDPLHESAVRRLMRLYAQTGRRSTAIQLYRTLGDALKADLGAQPEAETRNLFEEISRGEEQPVASPAVAAITAPPSPSPPSLSLPPTAGHPGDEGLMRRADTSILARATAGRRTWIVAGGVAAAMALIILAYPFVPWTGTGTTEQAQAGAITVVVLPFANLSSDPEQEFFSDGITEEVALALANLEGLTVLGRGSAFQFKGQNSDPRNVGRALNATHLIEGSVRKAGDRLRIGAQLVRAEDAAQLWSETYDRQLTDVFAIQEEIARAIAGALRVPLGLRQGGNLLRSRTTDPETYQLYLGARAYLRAYRSRPGDPMGMLEQAVARDPNYMPALALLARAYMFGLFDVASSFDRPVEESRRIVEATLSKAESAARRVIERDPDLADGYEALAAIQGVRGEYLPSEELHLKALALDPDSPDALHDYSGLLAAVGRLKEAVAMKQRLLALEPFVPVYNQHAGWVLWLNGENDAAIAIYEAMNPADRGPLPANLYASLGRYGEAADELASRNPASVTASILRTAPAKAASPQTLPRLDLTSFVYLYVGASDRFLESMERQVEAGFSDPVRNAEVWHPSPPYAAVRKTERFKAFARNAGLVEYWRAKGWPKFCRPIGADDFVCD